MQHVRHRHEVKEATSLLGVIAGLDNPTGGRVYVDGLDITDRVAALVRQTFALDSVATAASTLAGYRSQIAGGRSFVQIVGLLVIASLALLAGLVLIANTVALAMLERRRDTRATTRRPALQVMVALRSREAAEESARGDPFIVNG